MFILNNKHFSEKYKQTNLLKSFCFHWITSGLWKPNFRQISIMSVKCVHKRPANQYHVKWRASINVFSLSINAWCQCLAFRYHYGKLCYEKLPSKTKIVFSRFCLVPLSSSPPPPNSPILFFPLPPPGIPPRSNFNNVCPTSADRRGRGGGKRLKLYFAPPPSRGITVSLIKIMCIESMNRNQLFFTSEKMHLALKNFPTELLNKKTISLACLREGSFFRETTHKHFVEPPLTKPL